MRLLLVLLSAAWASVAWAEPKIEAIEDRLFDRQKNAIVPADKMPDDYGADADVLVTVAVKAPPDESPKQQQLTLTLTAPKSSDEATGSHAPWKLELKRAYQGAGEKGFVHYPFL